MVSKISSFFFILLIFNEIVPSLKVYFIEFYRINNIIDFNRNSSVLIINGIDLSIFNFNSIPLI